MLDKTVLKVIEAILMDLLDGGGDESWQLAFNRVKKAVARRKYGGGVELLMIAYDVVTARSGFMRLDEEARERLETSASHGPDRWGFWHSGGSYLP